jgi:gamma-glutamylcyclotransferase
MLRYFAYGSNLHIGRFWQRVPSARIVGKAVLLDYRLVFNKHGTDNSGKCNIMPGAAQVHGVIYEIDAAEKELLDHYEAGYQSRQVTVIGDDGELVAFTYIASEEMINPSVLPYHWYKLYVLHGARFHGLDPDYCSIIESQLSIEDGDADRNHRHLTFLGLNPKQGRNCS